MKRKPAAIRRRLYKLTRAVWRTMMLTRLVNLVSPKLPDAASAWLERTRLRAVVGSGERLVPEDRLEAMYGRALTSLVERGGPESIGDYLEFGVYTGTSLLCMDRATKAVGLDEMRLFGFDSFQGLPAAADDEPGRWRAGYMRSNRDYVLSRLAENDVEMERVSLIQGWFDETLDENLIRDCRLTKASVVLIDCDLYSSAKTALTFVAPLIRDRAFIFFDDWNTSGLAEQGLGESKAFEEFLAANPDLTAEEFEGYRRRESRVFLVSRRVGSTAS
jgi:O-methyltransferase